MNYYALGHAGNSMEILGCWDTFEPARQAVLNWALTPKNHGKRAWVMEIKQSAQLTGPHSPFEWISPTIVGKPAEPVPLAVSKP